MEFLMLLNKFSGRSMNDLSQPLIFPYVLSDYSSNFHDFNEKLKQNQCFRDFSKNLALMGNKETEVIVKYTQRQQIRDKRIEKNKP
jgi:hypothetical protein